MVEVTKKKVFSAKKISCTLPRVDGDIASGARFVARRARAPMMFRIQAPRIEESLAENRTVDATRAGSDGKQHWTERSKQHMLRRSYDQCETTAGGMASQEVRRLFSR